jgi:hypothetical protein
VSTDSDPTAGEVGLGTDGFPWASGVVTGVVTFLAGYLAFFAVVVVGARSLSGSLANVARAVGLFFYNAHFVPTRNRATYVVESNENGATQEITEQVTQNTLLDASTALPTWVYLLVPALVAVAAGVLFARAHFQSPAHPRALVTRALAGGAAVALGYLLVALVGSFVVAERVTQGEAFRQRQPARLRTLLVGAVYPFVLVSLGSGLGQALDRIRGDAETARSTAQTTGEDRVEGPADTGDGE